MKAIEQTCRPLIEERHRSAAMVSFEAFGHVHKGPALCLCDQLSKLAFISLALCSLAVGGTDAFERTVWI